MVDLAQEHIRHAHAGDTRRDFLILTAGALGAVAVAATVWPFVDTMNPAPLNLTVSPYAFTGGTTVKIG